MKKFFVVMLKVALAVLFIGPLAFGQFASRSQEPAHIVHYSKAPKLDSRRPDFTKVLVAIDMREPFHTSALRKLRELNVGDFIEGKNPCGTIKQSHVCIRAEVGGSANITASSYSANSGRNGGTNNQSSMSGSLTDLIVTVTLYEYDDKGHFLQTLDLGRQSTLAPAGTSTEYFGSYGGNSSGFFGYTATSGLEATASKAINDDLTGLFVPWFGSFKKFGQKVLAGKIGGWNPGADLEVENAFRSKVDATTPHSKEPQQMAVVEPK